MALPVDLESDGSVVWEAEDSDFDLKPGERYTEGLPPTPDEIEDIVAYQRENGATARRIAKLRRLVKEAVERTKERRGA